MKTDLYSKVVLTIIAVLLMISVVQTHLEKDNQAVGNVTQPNTAVDLGSQPLKVDIVRVDGQEIFVDYTDLGILKHGIPVRLVD